MAASTPEEGIRRTLAQYGPLLDEGRFVEWGDLFTVDARFHVLGDTREGRRAIQTWITAAMPPEVRGKHAMLTSVIDVADDERSARAWTDFVFVDQNRQITSVGRYHDELLAGEDARWRFTLREIVFLGDNAQVAQPVPG